MSILGIVLFAALGLRTYVLLRWIDPIRKDAVGVERVMQYVDWTLRYLFIIIFLVGLF